MAEKGVKLSHYHLENELARVIIKLSVDNPSYTGDSPAVLASAALNAKLKLSPPPSSARI